MNESRWLSKDLMLPNLKCLKEGKLFLMKKVAYGRFHLEKLLKHIFGQEFVTC